VSLAQCQNQIQNISEFRRQLAGSGAAKRNGKCTGVEYVQSYFARPSVLEMTGHLKKLAGATGLEPAASCVTGRRSNQLNYAPAYLKSGLITVGSL
jgi:hypothetical protein